MGDSFSLNMKICLLLAFFSSCYGAAVNTKSGGASFALLDRSKLFTSKTTTSMTLKRVKFTCSITLVHTYTEVIIKESKLQCKPSKPTKLKQKNIRFTVKNFSFQMDISINPTKIIKAIITDGPPEPTKAPRPAPKTTAGNEASSFSTPTKTTESNAQPTTTTTTTTTTTATTTTTTTT